MDLPGGKRVTLRGTAVSFGTPPVIVPGGYALTPDVDEEFANEWFRIYANLDMVKNRIIYIASKAQDARAMSKELAEVKTGLEPTNPEKPGPGLEAIRA